MMGRPIAYESPPRGLRGVVYGTRKPQDEFGHNPRRLGPSCWTGDRHVRNPCSFRGRGGSGGGQQLWIRAQQ